MSSRRNHQYPRSQGFFDPRTYLDRDKLISRDKLKRLESHKYNSEGTSILEPYLQPFWRRIVEFLPLWLAPNLITLTGLLANLSSAAICFIACPTAKSPGSENRDAFLRTMFLVNAVTLFLYQTLDAIDGKQARRTNTSSPLGELFDHGMDSISVILVSNVTFICFGAGAEPGLMFVFCLVCNIGYYMSHWSAYITGKLQFASFDVTEGQFFSMATYFLTYLYGQEVWSVEIAFGVNPRHILFYAPLFLLFCRLIRDHMRRIIIGGVGPSGSTVAETSVLSPSTPLIFLLTLVIVIYGHRDSQLMSEYPILFTTMFGLCFSKISNKLILAHMSRSELEIWDRSWYSLVLLILNQYFNCVIPQLLLLWVSFIWIVADLIYYLTAVYIEIAEHFKIKILTIPGPKRE